MDRAYPDDVLLGITSDASVNADDPEALTFWVNDVSVRLQALSDVRRSALQDLMVRPVQLDELAQRIFAQEGLTGVSFLHQHLGHLRNAGLLTYTLALDGHPIATCIPQAVEFRLKQPDETSYSYLLSRFAYLRRERQMLQVESSVGLGRLVIHDPGVLVLVAQLAAPSTLDSLCVAGRQFDRYQISVLLGMLWSCGALSLVDAQGCVVEDQQEHLRQWEFHDLLFHRLSRAGWHRNRYGATQRFDGIIKQPPKLKYYPEDVERVLLDLPDLEALVQHDPLFGVVLEQRRSLRTPGRPLTLTELSAFLYRSARIREPSQAEARSKGGRRMSEPLAYMRPYPGGGARYELELYLSVHRCDGLEPGLYHYQPLEHALARVRPFDAHVQGMIQYAMQATSAPEPPDVLITLAACFQRMTWRYEAMAYAATLKNVGVLYQTMYLVATALGLAPCALGYGNTALFAAAARTDSFIEGSVGEFMLSGGAGG